MGSSRRIEKCPQSGWGCMGGGATDQCLEGHIHPVQLYNSEPRPRRDAERRNAEAAILQSQVFQRGGRPIISRFGPQVLTYRVPTM